MRKFSLTFYGFFGLLRFWYSSYSKRYTSIFFFRKEKKNRFSIFINDNNSIQDAFFFLKKKKSIQDRFEG